MGTAPDAPVTTQGHGDSGLKLTSWDVGFLASSLVVLAGSLVPLITVRWGVNLWGVYNLFFLGIGLLLPLTAAGFLVARAASGQGTRDAGPRLGSLSTDQFAHVAAWLALAFYFVTFATTLDPVLLIGLAGSLGLVVTSPLRGLVAPLVAGSGETRATSHAPAVAPGTTTAPAPGAGEVRDPLDPAHTSGDAAPAGAGPDALDPAAAASTTTSDAWPADGSAADSFPSPGYGQPEAQGSPGSSEDLHSSSEAGNTAGHSPEQAGERPDAGPTGSEIDEELGMTRVRPRSTDEAAASATAAFGAPATEATEATEVTNAADETDAAEMSGSTGTTGLAEPAQSSPRGTEPADYEAFWFAVGTRRSAVAPEDGSPVFDLEPGGWILALEDRRHEFLVQNTDGRTGVLRDLTDIERA